jgi:tRNA threonylcarbamoyladenosine biosynthesis protein TsaB
LVKASDARPLGSIVLHFANLESVICNPQFPAVLILAFDTSGFAGSVAVLDGSRILHEIALDADRGSARTLAPAIAGALKNAGLEPAQIKLVATTVGPGSFTGLRVGVTTAKTFAYAVGAEVLGISTLEAIAHGVPPGLLTGEAREIQAVLDAQRRELFVGRFHSADSQGADNPVCQPDNLPALARIEPNQIIAADQWLASLASGTIATGTGLTKLEPRLPSGVIAVPDSDRQPRAIIVGRLAWRDYQRGRRDDLWKLAPVYLRPSYAEEKAAKTTSRR